MPVLKDLKGFIPNTVRVRKIGSKYLLTDDCGRWHALDKEEYFSFLKAQVSDELFEKLEKKGMVITEHNKEEVIQNCRNKKLLLFQGTCLHIIVATLRCNHNCLYCQASSKPINAKETDMSMETAKKTVDFIFQSPSKAITIEFQGGEPLLNFPVVKFIIDYAKELNKKHKKDLRFSIVTNLSLMSDEILDFLIKNRIGICTSLDGPEIVHNKNRPYSQGNSFEITSTWIKKILSQKGNISALVTTTRHSFPYYKEIVDTYKELGLKRIWIRPVNRLGTAGNAWKAIGYTPEEFFEFWKKCLDYIIRNKLDMTDIFTEYLLKKILTGYDPYYLDLMSPCGAAIGQMAYNHDGDIYSCDEARMIKEEMFLLGNVHESAYKDIMSSDQVKGLVSASVNDCLPCDNCAYKPYCGVCPVCSYAIYNNLIPKLPSDFRCRLHKKQFDYVFEKLIFDEDYKKVFMKWVGV